MSTVQKVRRVYENEEEYDEREDLVAQFDDMSDEWFKVIVTESNEDLELRLTETHRKEVLDLVEKTRCLLGALTESLDIYSTKGLHNITRNLHRVNNTLTLPSV